MPDNWSYLSNPCSAFISGSEERFYTFEPGSKLFHFNLRGKGHIIANGLMFANDEVHVREILQGYVDFRDECRKIYKSRYQGRRDEHILNALAGNMDFTYTIGDRKEVRKDRLTLLIQEAPMNQMFKTGWKR